MTKPVAASGDDEINWIWPTGGPVLSGFDEVKNKGLDIGGAAGDPVLAAADGRVVYVGAGLRGYGNLIILKHNITQMKIKIQILIKIMTINTNINTDIPHISQ